MPLNPDVRRRTLESNVTNLELGAGTAGRAPAMPTPSVRHSLTQRTESAISLLPSGWRFRDNPPLPKL